MELALYHPEGGYYCQPGPRVGRSGDFKTSPHQSPWFGRMVARQAEAMWEAMGNPYPFFAVEFGPGEGWLAHDILEAIESTGSLAAALEYTLIEQSAPARERIRERLARWTGGAANLPSARLESDPPEEIEGLIIAHEFLDALPVHILTGTGSGLAERYVELRGEKLALLDGPLSDKRLEGWLGGLGVELESGQTAEVCLPANEWIGAIGRRLRRGGVLIFDYGFSSRVLYHPSRRDGTIRGYRAHTMTDDPLNAPGETDLTAHVDFSSILRSAEDCGLSLAGFTDQSHYLLDMGIAEALQAKTGNEMAGASERRSAMGLLDPSGLGSAIKVMLLTRGLEDAALPGFSMKPDDRESLATLRP
jgi:SAM-dependent MidA family methyltransferase